MEKVRIHYIECEGIGLYKLQKKNCKDWVNYISIGKMISPSQLRKFKYEVKSKWEVVLSPSARESIFNQK